MSTINFIHDLMLQAIATALPTYKKLSNPYTTSDNAEVFLNNGYGVTIGAASQKRVMTGSVGVERYFSFILTKECFATKNDEQRKADAALELANDQLAVMKAFELDFTLGGKVLKIEYGSDEGVQFVQGQSEKFIELKTTVSVLYIEPVT
jgi:hypothetical protein